jgi:hypothetical protein
MDTNGVPLDARTKYLVNQAITQIGSQNIWVEDSELEGGGVWTLVKKIEDLVRRSGSASFPKKNQAGYRQRMRVNDWKYDKMEDRDDDGFGFGKWDARESFSGGFRPEGSQKL